MNTDDCDRGPMDLQTVTEYNETLSKDRLGVTGNADSPRNTEDCDRRSMDLQTVTECNKTLTKDRGTCSEARKDFHPYKQSRLV